MKKNEVIVVLHNIRSLHNVGSIFRTADAAGVSKLYLCGVTPKPVDRFGAYRQELQKVALGAERTVLWEHFTNTTVLLKRLKGDGYKIFAVEQAPGSKRFDAIRLQKGEKIALVLGDEVRGLSPLILRTADTIIEIPMHGVMVRQAHHPKNQKVFRGKESLNVSVAFGIIIFSLLYQ